jgi:hypothetical protein
MAEQTPVSVSQTDFDFKAYNAVMSKANNGLKLFLAQQMLTDCLIGYTRWNSPLKHSTSDVVDEIVEIRRQNKLLAAKAANTTTVSPGEEAEATGHQESAATSYQQKDEEKGATHRNLKKVGMGGLINEEDTEATITQEEQKTGTHN